MVSDLSNRHPQYSEGEEDFILMRDSYRGQKQVKRKRFVYLPATTAQVMDGVYTSRNSVGYHSYMAYLSRARYPNFVREAVQMAIGMMHSQPPSIKLPAVMEGIRSNLGESLPTLLRRINTEQLITGRVGLMADLPTVATLENDTPYLATYTAEKIINWDNGATDKLNPQKLNLVVLDETEDERGEDGFSWTQKEKYRILTLGALADNESIGEYKQGVFNKSDFELLNLVAPQRRGLTLDEIPFIIINSCDCTPDVDDPPLLDLGNATMTIYRADADYRQNLHLQGQDTLITIGGNLEESAAVRVGAGARIDLPLGADAKYIGVDGSGLSEQREALGRLESRASSMGAQTLDTTSRERESGDSLRIRVAARTADMNQIVDTGAAALERILKICATWMGEDPTQVEVKPNKEFGEMPLTGQSMVEMATARNLGYPISAKSLHDIAFKRRITKLDWEEEQSQAKTEEGAGFVFAKAPTGSMAGADQNGPGAITQKDPKTGKAPVKK